MKITINKKIIGYLWLSVLLCGLAAYLLFPKTFNLTHLVSLIQDNYWLAIIIFLLIICLRGLLFITPLTITLASSVFFPPLTVFFINSFGILISSTLIYKFSHFLGFDEYFDKRYKSKIDKIKNSLEKKEITIIFAWSFLPVFPTDLIVYICASIKISLWKCLIGVFLGTAIINAIFIYSLNFFLPPGDVNINSVPQINLSSLIASTTDPVISSIATSTIPLFDARARVTKKPFGIKITRETSPVQPEKFSGYHTGVDFEVLAGEENIDVNVFAICDGPLLLKKYASGYGGVAVQKCTLDKKVVTVIYGHLKLASVKPAIGDELKTGDSFAVLGKGYSPETDGERKHLHLGIHLGNSINILGYVKKPADLSGWLNALDYIP